MDDLEQRLAKMSAKATPGEWNCSEGVEEADEMRCGITTQRGNYAFLIATIENGAPGDLCETEAANANLVNAYRAGELVPATTLAAKDAEIAKMREALNRIEHGWGHCRTCGTPCEGFTDCDCDRPTWEPDDPQVIAARATGADHD